MYVLAERLHKTVAEIGAMARTEMAGWRALERMRKKDQDAQEEQVA